MRERSMASITKKEIEMLADKYGIEPVDIQDRVNDMEGDGIAVDATLIEDMIINDDLY